MSASKPITFLCLSGEFKGVDFLTACKEQGHKVYLVTAKKLEHKPWPREHLDDIFFMEEVSHCVWNMDDLMAGLAHFMRSQTIDRIVALDDFDVEKAAQLREHFRIPGMGQTTSRYFRDKLAMRMKAEEAGIPVPPFSSLFNDEAINAYLNTIPAPWVIKPRAEASATGIKKVHSAEEAWQVLNELGDQRHQYLIEQFKPGDVYHADALTVDGEVQFCRVSRYLNTPFEVAHGGGIFRSHICEFGAADDRALQVLNAKVMQAFGMQFSASHTEFIRSKADGQFYFLETSSRVGGAHLAEMVEYSSGINLWREWAIIESCMAHKTAYTLPPVSNDYAGIVVSLSRFERPDMSGFSDPEVCWRIDKDYHVGMIVRASERERVVELLDDYAERIYRDFHASAPSK